MPLEPAPTGQIANPADGSEKILDAAVSIKAAEAKIEAVSPNGLAMGLRSLVDTIQQALTGLDNIHVDYGLQEFELQLTANVQADENGLKLVLPGVGDAVPPHALSTLHFKIGPIPKKEDDTATVVIRSTPESVSILVDGASVQTPHTFLWAKHSTHVVSAPKVSNVHPTDRLTFIDWSDGQAQTHPVLAVQDQTLTARFRKQYLITIATDPPFASGVGVSVQPPSEDGFHFSGNAITLSASIPTPSAGIVFGAWAGDILSTQNPITVTVDRAQKITAVYDSVPLIGGEIFSRGGADRYFVALRLRNARQDDYTDMDIRSAQYEVSKGTNQITPITSFPIQVGVLAAGAVTSDFRFEANIPTTIAEWNLTLAGTVRNNRGRQLPWSTKFLVIR